jgi:hypothetical protein
MIAQIISHSVTDYTKAGGAPAFFDQMRMMHQGKLRPWSSSF